jgi:hypothetical protein
VEVLATGGNGKRPSSWRLFLTTLPPVARGVAWLLWLVRTDFFAEDLRVFHRLVDGPDPDQVAWVRGYLSHPRYRRASLLRRLGLRGRVSLLDAWARRSGKRLASTNGREKT